MIKALHKLDYEIDCIFPEDGGLIEMCSPYISDYVIMKLPWWFGEPTGLIGELRLLKNILTSAYTIVKYLRNKKIKTIIINTISIPSPAIAAKLLGLKIYWFIHELGSDDKFELIFGERFTKKMIGRISDIVICNSKFIKNSLKEYVSLKKLRVAYQAVEIDNNLIRNNKTENLLDLIIVGRFSVSKGQLEAINVLDLLIQRHESFRLTLVGINNSDYSKFVVKVISDKKLEKFIEIVGPTNKIFEYYQKSDIVLVCSQNEAFGRVTVEAMKYGLPVIAGNINGSIELIEDGINGFKYEFGNTSDLIEKILLLKDLNLREEIGNRAKKWANEIFSIDNFSHSLSEILS